MSAQAFHVSRLINCPRFLSGTAGMIQCPIATNGGDNAANDINISGRGFGSVLRVGAFSSRNVVLGSIALEVARIAL